MDDPMLTLRPRRHYRAILVFLLATNGCAAATGPEGRATVAVVDGGQAIAITNRTSRPIFTFVVDRQEAALINWAPCVSGPSCPPLPPGDTRLTPFPAGPRSGEQREALVYWWHAVPGHGGGFRAGEVKFELVRL